MDRRDGLDSIFSDEALCLKPSRMSLTEGMATWRLIVAVVVGNESNYGRTMLLLSLAEENCESERCCCRFRKRTTDRNVVVGRERCCCFVGGSELGRRCRKSERYFVVGRELIGNDAVVVGTSLSEENYDCLSKLLDGGTGLCSPVRLDRTGGIKFIVYECVEVIDKIINH